MSFDRSDDWIISIHSHPIAEETAFPSVQQNAALRQSNRYLEISAPARPKYGVPQAHRRTRSLKRSSHCRAQRVKRPRWTAITFPESDSTTSSFFM
jgi:hypothetical protein